MITLETKIQNTELTKNIKNILSTCNIFTVESLLNTDIERLKRIRGLGKNRLKEIVCYFNSNGFYFKE